MAPVLGFTWGSSSRRETRARALGKAMSKPLMGDFRSPNDPTVPLYMPQEKKPAAKRPAAEGATQPIP
jgi:hypothetical protein